MPWFKVDDGFWSHPKVLDLDPSAIALWVRAGSYAAQHLTDGSIRRSALRMLGHEATDADALVASGLWDATETGYLFHDWSRYQPPSAASKQKRDEVSQKRAEAGRLGAAKRWQEGRQDDDKGGGKLPLVTDGNAIAPSRPVPSRPEEASLLDDGEAKLRATRIPKDWAPTKAHIDLARERRVNLLAEADAFRLHAETHDRHAARWNAAFTTWLKKARSAGGQVSLMDQYAGRDFA